MKPELHIVAPATKPETVSEKVRRLQAEAKAAASSHVQDLRLSMAETHGIAAAIASGGDAYSTGARGIARDVCRALESHALILQSITERS